MKKTISASLIGAIAISLSANALACSNILWNSEHGTVVTRTMDWMETTQPALMSVRQGEKRSLHGILGGDLYETKNNYLAIAAYGKLIAEGVNEHGMQISVQYYRDMKLPKAKASDVSQVELAGYLLSQTDTVDQAVKLASQLKVGLVTLPDLPEPSLFHYIISDKTGDRALLQFDEDGLEIYRGDEAAVVTNNPGQKIHLAAWNQKKSEIIQKGGFNRAINLEAGNTDSQQRFIFSNYYLAQLKTSTSPINAMMSVEGTAFKVPQQAAYGAADSGMPTYATEYGITYNLDSGDVVFKYMGGDHWSQQRWNFKTLLASKQNIHRVLYK